MYLPTAKVLVFQAKPAVSELTLARSGSIGGVVRAEGTGAGVTGVTVRLWDGAWKLVGAVTTDSAGAYRFEGVAQGAHIVSVDVPTGFEADDERCSVTVSPRGTVEAAFTLRDSGEVRGRIVDETMGTPLSGVAVNVVDAQGRHVAEGRTSETGDYEFHLPKAQYRVELRR